MSRYGVIFDMDGVLVDSYRPHYESWQITARARDLEMPPALFADVFGQTNADIIPRLMPGAAKEDIDRWSDEKEQAYRDILAEDFPAMDGACKLVRNLKQDGARLAVGSSGPRENVLLALEQLPCGGCFEAYVSREDITAGKPDPEVFLTAAGEMEIEPKRCAVIEDSIVGLEAARAAGMIAIGLTGTADAVALTPHADRVIESLRDIDAGALRNMFD